MTRLLLVPFLLAMSLATVSSAQQAKAGGIAGIYLANDKDHKIELYLVGEELRGRIVWTAEKGVLDKHNKDPKLRSRPVVGIEHIHGLKREDDDTWNGGVLYNPEDGKFYDAKLWLNGTRLVVRGKPRIAVVGGLLGALFGRITYTRVGDRPSAPAASAKRASSSS